jgi:hypothetical protein
MITALCLLAIARLFDLWVFVLVIRHLVRKDRLRPDETGSLLEL